MRAGVDLKAVCNSVVIQDLVQLDRVEAQSILIADVDRDRAVLLQVSSVLVDEGKRGVRRELCDDLRLGNAVFRGKVEVQRGILRIGRPGGRVAYRAAPNPGDCAARSARRLGRRAFFSPAIARSLVWSAGPGPPPGMGDMQQGLMM